MALLKNININVNYFSNDTNVSILNKIDTTVTNTMLKTVTVPNAYIKIINLTGDKNNINITIGIYDDKDGNLLDQIQACFTPSVESGSLNFIKQGYEYLKTLSDYLDATDC